MTLKKVSFTIRGHRTSVSLEPEFHEALREIAQRRQMAVAQLVAEVDAARAPEENLSSALRLLVLRHYREAAAGRS